MELARKQPDSNSAYKQTGLGLIPSDWEVKKLGELVVFSGGSQPPRFTFSSNKKLGYIRLIQIRDYKTDNFETYAPENMVKKWCNKDDIMIGRYGPPIFQILRGLEGAYNVALIKAIPNHLLDREYLYYFLKQESLFQFIESLSQRSSGQTGIDMEGLKTYPFPLPPTIEEQKAIAEALSNVDELIEGLEKLIVKKRNLKQGTMQELLTGKTRLAGFSREWEEKKVKDFGEVVTGSTPPTQKKEFWNGNIPWVTPTDISDKRDISTTEREITISGLSVIRKLPSGSVLITCIASIGKNAILRKDGACNQQINAIVPNVHNDGVFIYYLMQNSKNKLLSNAGITSTHMISKKDFSEIAFLVPTKQEQTAIAQILSDMDGEIGELEKRRDKYKNIKQGMMQELLTGKIRLI